MAKHTLPTQSFTFFAVALVLYGVLALLPGCGENAGRATVGPAEPSAPAAALESTTQRGPLTVRVQVTPREPRLSDLIALDIFVTAALEVDVKPPAFGEAVGDFLVRDYAERAVRIEDGKRVRHFHYRIEPTYAGKHLIRSVPIEFIDNRPDSESKGELLLAETEPLEIEVTSELGTEAPNLADLAPMTPPKPLPGKPLSTVILVIVACVALLCVFAFVWLRRRKPAAAPEIVRTPEEIAQAELAALLARNLPGQGLLKEFYVELTGILRRYIERTTGIRAPEQTTEEFLEDMRRRKVFDPDKAERLAKFLEAADMVKYAAQQPGQREVEEAVSRAREFIGMASALAPLPAAAQPVQHAEAAVR